MKRISDASELTVGERVWAATRVLSTRRVQQQRFDPVAQRMKRTLVAMPTEHAFWSPGWTVVAVGRATVQIEGSVWSNETRRHERIEKWVPLSDIEK